MAEDFVFPTTFGRQGDEFVHRLHRFTQISEWEKKETFWLLSFPESV